MVEKIVTSAENVVDFVSYQLRMSPTSAVSARFCRHCGAALADDENDDDCSSAGLAVARPVRSVRRRRFVAD